jgi:hypothetical protein
VAPGADLRIVERSPLGLTRSRVLLRAGERARQELGFFDEIELDLPLLGDAGAYAAAAALLVAATLRPGLDPGAMRRAFAEIEGEGGRLQALQLADGTVILDDSYNANGASVVASLRTAAELARRESPPRGPRRWWRCRETPRRSRGRRRGSTRASWRTRGRRWTRSGRGCGRGICCW